MNYKITIQDNFTVWRARKTVYLNEVDTILKPSRIDDSYTFLNEDKKVIYITPALNVVSIELINNKKEKENE